MKTININKNSKIDQTKITELGMATMIMKGHTNTRDLHKTKLVVLSVTQPVVGRLSLITRVILIMVTGTMVVTMVATRVPPLTRGSPSNLTTEAEVMSQIGTVEAAVVVTITTTIVAAVHNTIIMVVHTGATIEEAVVVVVATVRVEATTTTHKTGTTGSTKIHTTTNNREEIIGDKLIIGNSSELFEFIKRK